MELVLLDTDVFSFYHRGDTRAAAYEADIQGRVRCLSFASVAELRFGALIAKWGEQRRRKLEQAISRTVILPGDNETTQEWARIKAARQKRGNAIASEGCWVAASAVRHGIRLLTHNARHFQDIEGLVLVSHGSQ